MNKHKIRVALALLLTAGIGLTITGTSMTDSLLANLQGFRSTFHYASYDQPTETTSERPESPYVNESLRIYGDISNAEGLVKSSGKDIITTDGEVTSETLLNLLFAAKRYRENPILDELLPLHHASMTTAKNWSAFLSPQFPGVGLRGVENPDTYLSGYEIASALADQMLQTNADPINELVRLGIIDQSERAIWDDTNPRGILLSDAVGLVRRMVLLAERKSVEDLVAYSRAQQSRLPEGQVQFQPSVVEVLLRAFAHEDQSMDPDDRTVKKYLRDMRGYQGQILNSAMVRELRDRYHRADAPAVYVPFHQWDLGSCDEYLLEKLTLAPYFETGDLGLTASCDVELPNGENGEVRVSIPPQTTVINLHGAPAFDDEARLLQFPQELSNTLLIGPEGEVPVQLVYQSQKRKPRGAKMGFTLFDSDGQPVRTMTSLYDGKMQAKMSLSPRHIGGDEFFVKIDPLLQ